MNKNIYETSGHSSDTITLKNSMPNIISNRPFYSDHSTYLEAHYGKKGPLGDCLKGLGFKN